MHGQAGAPKNPRAVAEAILANLPASPVLGEKPTLAGPGFINVRISIPFIAERISHMLQHGTASWAPVTPYKRAVIDFSSPNVAKEMHVGHLRSTIIGDTLACTLEYCGIDVLRINHVVGASNIAVGNATTAVHALCCTIMPHGHLILIHVWRSCCNLLAVPVIIFTVVLSPALLTPAAIQWRSNTCMRQQIC